MKNCKYCNTDYPDSETNCPSCQSKDFSTKCDVCGTVHDGGVCPKCKVAQAPQSTTTTIVHVNQKDEDAKAAALAKSERKKKGWTIALLIIFPPIGILLTWVLMKNWAKKTKIIVSVASAIWFIIAMSSNGGSDSTDTTSPSDSSSTSVSTTNDETTTTAVIDEAFLDAAYKEQPLYVKTAKLTAQTKDSSLKNLYPDMLQAIIYNNTTEDLKSAVVAFVAWDKNNLPVKIEEYLSIVDKSSYLVRVNFSEINLVAGASYGDKSGYKIDNGADIEKVKAIVVSYETFEGETWKNPYYDDFVKLYEGKKLAQ